MSRYPVITHPTCASDAPKSSLITGTATLTIELFITAMTTAEMRTTRSKRVETCWPPPAWPAVKPLPRRSRRVRHLSRAPGCASPPSQLRAGRGRCSLPSGCRLCPRLSNACSRKSLRSQYARCKSLVYKNVLLIRGEVRVYIGPHLRQEPAECPPLPDAHTREGPLFNHLPAPGERFFERAPLAGEVNAEAPGVPRVPAALHEAALLEAAQHLGDRRRLDAEPLRELPAPQPILLEELYEDHVLADVQPQLRQVLPDVSPVRLADLRERVAGAVFDSVDPYHALSSSTDRLFGL